METTTITSRKRKAGTAATAGRKKSGQLLATRSQVKRMITRLSEKKLFIGTIAASTAITTTGDFTSLTLVPQGDAYYHRDGAEIRPLKVFARLFFKANATTAPHCIRFMIVKWKADTLNHAISGATLLEDSSTLPWSSPPKWDASVATVLYDKMFHIGDAGPEGRALVVNLTKGLGRVHYNASANSGTGHIYMAVFSNNAAANEPTYEGQYGCIFADH